MCPFRRFLSSAARPISFRIASPSSTETAAIPGKGDTVAIMAANTPELFEAHFGIPMAGAVLNTINTRLEAEIVCYILEHGDA